MILGKLVRDKIPDIIKLDGKCPIIKTLSEEDYLKELDKKLNEEVSIRPTNPSRKWLMF